MGGPDTRIILWRVHVHIDSDGRHAPSSLYTVLPYYASWAKNVHAGRTGRVDMRGSFKLML